jgi:carbamoyltransferase
MPKVILGISAYYHDSSAALIIDGQIVAAAQEERFTRIKQDAAFPKKSIEYVLAEGHIIGSELDAIVFYEKPFIKFERLLETYHVFAPNGLKSFINSIPVWIKEKLFMKMMLQKELALLNIPKTIPLLFPEHHHSHAASAFYPSPFNESAILTIDGVGEFATTTIAYGQGNSISILKELHFPHSLGLLYSAFTFYCGFKVNSGEYKLMGLAPYGNKNSERVQRYIMLIKTHMIDIRSDGSFLLNMDFFEYATGLEMCNKKKWKHLLGIPFRSENEPLTSEYTDLAMAIQQITDEIVLMLAKTAKELTQCNNLVMAGGVSLNCVSN